MVVCPTAPSPDAAALVARRISESLRAPSPSVADQIELSASVGVAWTDRPDESPDALIARADGAMYQSKLEDSGAIVLAECALPVTVSPDPAEASSCLLAPR